MYKFCADLRDLGPTMWAEDSKNSMYGLKIKSKTPERNSIVDIIETIVMNSNSQNTSRDGHLHGIRLSTKVTKWRECTRTVHTINSGNWRETSVARW
ncbi:hypothetical protein PR048_028980 [Dryococelus australis]|uniref:Uncharacterized protein n=1 Tax=Dryococelus australis TaxID=614101 RepID=A0ABQ9GFP3_9NEOP|nr:hypothetical protein PR048_028980 [Dryococelus australis]